MAVSYATVSSPMAGAEVVLLSVPSITATSKGPDQIDLTWSAVSNPGYGYLVEIQSAGDSRYSDWTELQPIPTVGGYICTNTVVWNGGSCNITDPSSVHAHNTPTHGVPYWVTDATYVDPRTVHPGSSVQWYRSPRSSDKRFPHVSGATGVPKIGNQCIAEANSGRN